MSPQRLAARILFIWLSLLLVTDTSLVRAQSCGSTGLAVQVLGSSGPEMQDKRASTSYLIWENGKVRIFLDAQSPPRTDKWLGSAGESKVGDLLPRHFATLRLHVLQQPLRRYAR